MTIAGRHTVGELKDLLAAKDNIVTSLKAKWFSLGPKWQGANPVEADDWASDFEAFQERYASARRSAQTTIDHVAFAVIGDQLPAEDEYEGILRALTVQRNGSYEKGDVQDLYNRIAKVNGGNFGIPTPQPVATDADAAYLDKSGVLLKTLDQTADAAIERTQRAVAKSKLENAVPYVLAALAVGVGVSLYQKR